MAKIAFTAHLQALAPVDPVSYPAGTVGALIDAVTADHPAVRSYVLDDHGRVRKHIAIFVDGEMIRREAALSHRVDDSSEVYVLQALSGG